MTKYVDVEKPLAIGKTAYDVDYLVSRDRPPRGHPVEASYKRRFTNSDDGANIPRYLVNEAEVLVYREPATYTPHLQDYTHSSLGTASSSSSL